MLRVPASPPRWLGVVLLAAGALTFGLCLDCRYFGQLNDDARHYLAAQSLLKGRYADLSLPGEPPIVNQLPGYPLLLTPAAALGSTRLAQWASIFFLLAALALLLRLFRADGWAGLAAAALTALNPWTVTQATTVMAEAPFLLFTSFALALIARTLDRPETFTRSAALGLGALLGWCAWLRPQGAVLLLTAGLLLGPAALRGRAALALAVGAAAALAPYARNAAVAGLPASYFAELPTASASGWGPAASALGALVLTNAARYPGLVAETLLPWTEPVPGAGTWAASALQAAALAAAAGGLFLAWRRKDGLSRTAAFYTACYLALHLFWVNRSPRYVFPLLPFLYLFLFRFLARAPKPALGFAAGGILLFGVLDGAMAVRARTPVPGENAAPAALFAWVRAHTRADETVAATFREAARHHTGRKSVDLLSGEDPDRWLNGLRQGGVRYAIHRTGPLDLIPAAPSRSERLAAAARNAERQLNDPARARPVFAEPPFVVYELREPRGFARAYAGLEAGRAALDAGDLHGAYGRFLALGDAPLVRLPFYRGTTALLLARHAEARPWLEEAVRREPDFAPARRNLQWLERLAPPPGPGG